LPSFGQELRHIQVCFAFKAAQRSGDSLPSKCRHRAAGLGEEVRIVVELFDNVPTARVVLTVVKS
jgi:hypothetical protein